MNSSFCKSMFRFCRLINIYKKQNVAFSGSSTESPDDGRRGPIFLSEPPSLVVIPNTKGAAIPCGVYGNPAPLVTWVTEDGNKVRSFLLKAYFQFLLSSLAVSSTWAQSWQFICCMCVRTSRLCILYSYITRGILK